MSADGFSRTLQTAADAEGIAKLLTRIAKTPTTRLPFTDRQRLEHLGERYRDYAAALRETAAEAPPEPVEGQAVLL